MTTFICPHSAVFDRLSSTPKLNEISAQCPGRGVKYAPVLGNAIKIVASAQFTLSLAAEAVESSQQFSEWINPLWVGQPAWRVSGCSALWVGTLALNGRGSPEAERLTLAEGHLGTPGEACVGQGSDCTTFQVRLSDSIVTIFASLAVLSFLRWEIWEP